MNELALFIFAHQDDEFAIFSEIEAAVELGKDVICLYMTDGSASADVNVRNSESVRVLSRLGVRQENIIFVGMDMGFHDGRLISSVDRCYCWLYDFISERIDRVDCAYTMAWEGGHPDHDIVHAIIVHIFSRLDAQYKLKQFSLYNSDSRKLGLFNVMKPLIKSGRRTYRHIGIMDGFRYMSLCFLYRSQWKTWVGLSPFVAYRYLIDRKIVIQNTSIEILLSPPHEGKLYYEHRGWCTWAEMSAAVHIIFNK